jgi:hypothetical protein
MKRLLFALALAGCALAQSRGGRASKAPPSPVPVPDKWPIQTLSVEGNHVFPAAAILAVAGLKIGQLAGQPEFEAARDRLTASGAFETVGYKFLPAPDGKGFHASFQVAETTSLFPVKFEDLGLADADLAAALAARDRSSPWRTSPPVRPPWTAMPDGWRRFLPHAGFANGASR